MCLRHPLVLVIVVDNLMVLICLTLLRHHDSHLRFRPYVLGLRLLNRHGPFFFAIAMSIFLSQCRLRLCGLALLMTALTLGRSLTWRSLLLVVIIDVTLIRFCDPDFDIFRLLKHPRVLFRRAIFHIKNRVVISALTTAEIVHRRIRNQRRELSLEILHFELVFLNLLFLLLNIQRLLHIDFFFGSNFFH